MDRLSRYAKKSRRICHQKRLFHTTINRLALISFADSGWGLASRAALGRVEMT
jgi:hypothetical protein